MLAMKVHDIMVRELLWAATKSGRMQAIIRDLSDKIYNFSSSIYRYLMSGFDKIENKLKQN